VHGDDLIGGHLSIQPTHNPLNSSAPPALLRPDEPDDADDCTSDDGGRYRLCSRRSAVDASASDSVDTDEGTLQDMAERRLSLFVTDFGVRQRHLAEEHRRKSSLGHRTIWHLDHEADLARKVDIFVAFLYVYILMCIMLVAIVIMYTSELRGLSIVLRK